MDIYDEARLTGIGMSQVEATCPKHPNPRFFKDPDGNRYVLLGCKEFVGLFMITGETTKRYKGHYTLCTHEHWRLGHFKEVV